MFGNFFRNKGSNALNNPNIEQVPGRPLWQLEPGVPYSIDSDNYLEDAESARGKYGAYGPLVAELHVGDKDNSASFYIIDQRDIDTLRCITIAIKALNNGIPFPYFQSMRLQQNETLHVGRNHQWNAGYPNNISREQVSLELDSNGCLTIIGMKTTNPTYLRANLREAPGLEWPRQ